MFNKQHDAWGRVKSTVQICLQDQNSPASSYDREYNGWLESLDHILNTVSHWLARCSRATKLFLRHYALVEISRKRINKSHYGKSLGHEY